MKKTEIAPIKVALYGMDPRSYRTMELYLKGPCKGIAIVVDEAEADIDIIDADFATAGEILETRRQKTPQRPIILLSLQTLNVENTHFVQKPVKADQLSAVLHKLKPSSTDDKKAQQPIPKPTDNLQAVKTPFVVDDGNNAEEPTTSHLHRPKPEAEKAVKKRVMFEDNEGGYAAFLGTLPGIDFNDPAQLVNASFDPKVYFLGCVLSAYKIASDKKQALQLNSVWKPLMIFPDTKQVWLDADDKQLRAFAGIQQNKTFAGNMRLVPVDAHAFRRDIGLEKFQDMDAFIWKLAIWTSKGRFPVGLYPDHPVYLKYWPNFTRLLLIPEALRICALLIKAPRTPFDIIKSLDVKPQYVFAFISACHSLGILGRSERKIDEIIAPEPPKHDKKQGLLGKILQKLRAVSG